MDLLNGKSQVVLHTIGDHTKCGPSCRHRGKDLRVGFGLYERLCEQYGDPKSLDVRISLEGLMSMDRHELMEELKGYGGSVFHKLSKLSTESLRKKVAKIWGFDPKEVCRS